MLEYVSERCRSEPNRLALRKSCLMESNNVSRKIVSKVMTRRKENSLSCGAYVVSSHKPIAGVESVTSIARCEERKLNRPGGLGRVSSRAAVADAFCRRGRPARQTQTKPPIAAHNGRS